MMKYHKNKYVTLSQSYFNCYQHPMKYYRPDWTLISKTVNENFSKDQLNTAWSNECKKWLTTLQDELGSPYTLVESDNFIILSSEEDNYNQHFLKFLEYARTKILTNLVGIASDEGYGKHVVIIPADQETYYDYILMFYPEDAKVGLSGGVYLNDGYGHFVFPAQEINFTEPVAAHELTHGCLSHLPIPNWLNEGLAVSMEEVVLGHSYFEMNKKNIEKHQNYWNEDNIQHFWDGTSFSFPDEGQELSYHLAQLLVRNISHDDEQFKAFCNLADYKDAGEYASHQHLGISLGDLLDGLLGDGNWAPNSN